MPNRPALTRPAKQPPIGFTLLSNPRQRHKGAPNRRVTYRAIPMFPMGREYYLHSTKGWRSRALEIDRQIDEPEDDE